MSAQCGHSFANGNGSEASGNGDSMGNSAGPNSMPYGFPLNPINKETYPQLHNGGLG